MKIQEAQRDPNQINPNLHTQRHITVKMERSKDRESILKATREKQKVTYRRTHKTMSIFLHKNSKSQRRMARHILSTQ